VIAPDDRPWTGALGLGEERPESPAGQVSSPLKGEPTPAAVEPRPGMGVVFDAGRPEDKNEPGGPIFRVERRGEGWVLGFGNPGPDLGRVAVGQRVWLNSDPALVRRVEGLLAQGEPEGRIPLELTISGSEGSPLRIQARAWGHESSAVSPVPLALARGGGLDEALLRDKLGAFGGTPFRLARLDCSALTLGLHLPVSELKALRRQLVTELTAAVEKGYRRTVVETPVVDKVRASALEHVPAAPVEEAARLLPLCRNDAQLEAVIAAGLREVELDWMEMVGLQRAVERARAAGMRVTIATVRVQKPGEEGYDQRIDRLRPDAVLVRHWGAMMHFLERPEGQPRPVLHGDFSLNVTNSVTAAYLLGLGLDTLTFSHDLDATQLFALLEQAPTHRFTVALHHHIATFHTEHCVYSHTLSNGRDFRTCGRPCEKHQISLRDRLGLDHPVIVDVGCRNTVFNAQAQSAASLVPRLIERGVRRFRVEFVRESQEEAARVLSAYQELLAGRLAPAEAVRRAAVHEQFGVTKGTMKVLSPPASAPR
jgi:U32 family peptidase